MEKTNINNDFEDDAQTVGEILRNARLKQAKTINDASKELCIRKVYLEAIEKMDLEKIPAMPYGLGFVRSYAEYLGLNSNRIMFSYKKAVLKEEDENKEISPEISYSGPKLKHIITAIILLVILLFAWNFRDKISAYFTTEVQSANENISAANTVVFDDGAEVIAPEGSIPEETVEEEDTDNSEDSNEDKTIAKESETTTTEAMPATSRVKLLLKGPSWVELKKGDNVLLSGVYHKGFEYEIPAEKGFVISIGRYYNAEFYIDGKLTKVVSSIKHKNVNLDEVLEQN